jgi:hypothetical protein
MSSKKATVHFPHYIVAKARTIKRHGEAFMESISVACYKPRPGKEEALLELVRNHLPPLRA